jgi:hypothetical protein
MTLLKGLIDPKSKVLMLIDSPPIWNEDFDRDRDRVIAGPGGRIGILPWDDPPGH